MISILLRQYLKMQFLMYSKRSSNIKRNITFVKNWHLPRDRERTHCIKRLCGFCTLDTTWLLAIPLPHINIDDKFQMFFWCFSFVLVNDLLTILFLLSKQILYMWYVYFNILMLCSKIDFIHSYSDKLRPFLLSNGLAIYYHTCTLL